MVEAKRSAKTTNNCLTVLSAMTKWWHAEHDLPPPRYRVGPVKQPKDRRAAFEHEPFARLVRTAARHSSEDLVLVLLGGHAGLRMSEIRALHWTDCDLGKRPQLVVQRTREDDEELPPKGWRTRVVPMTPDLRQALQHLPRHPHDPHVLLHEGRPLTRNHVRSRFNRVQRSTGLPETGFHITRHTFCSHLAMQGVPASAIQALAGHADLSTTQRYMHLAPSALDDAIATLGNLLDLRFEDPAAPAAIPSPNPTLTPTQPPRFGHSLGTSRTPETRTAP
jgi:integrase